MFLMNKLVQVGPKEPFDFYYPQFVNIALAGLENYQSEQILVDSSRMIREILNIANEADLLKICTEKFTHLKKIVEYTISPNCELSRNC